MIQEVIEKKLHSELQPNYLKVINESYMHNVPAGSESHFKVIVVSDAFAEQRLIGRHRQIHTILADELEKHIHALAIHTYTTKEWTDEQDGAPDSPMCMGGGR